MKLIVVAGFLCVETACSIGVYALEGAAPACCWSAVGAVLTTAIPGAAKLGHVLFDRMTSAYGDVLQCDS
jgi:hypothetical protein